MKRIRRLSVAAIAVFLATASSPSDAQSSRKGTQTTLSVSPSPSVVGQKITLTATVTSGTDKPAGAMQFFIDEKLVATLPLSTDGAQSQAAIEVSKIAQGAHQIAARYQGHPNYFPSASPPRTHTVAAQ